MIAGGSMMLDREAAMRGLAILAARVRLDPMCLAEV